MAYLSLYRKYRSQGFDEILGQKHVTQTLKNALAAGTVAHAYLFTGPRGTGKTSTARVLAKALNCLCCGSPTPDPCGVCEACVRIRDGYSMDVMEIDAASTRGIDDIRDLREKVKFAPAQERVKVYVIDEVHQLTGEAFNALLKTLEEPPSNVVFVLATTELHKVPATILSRCQRFDFRRGSLTDLKERIETVCQAEGWTITPEAVTALAIGANGGYRDALSLLEQVAAYTSGAKEIALDDVNLVLGSVADEQLLAAADAIADKDAGACFRIVDEAMAAGVEVRQFLTGLRRRLRDLLMLAVGASTEDAAVIAPNKERLEEQSKSIPISDLLWCIDQLNEAERDLRWSPQQRLLLETTLVRLATRTAPAAPATVAAAAVATATAAPAPRPAFTPPPSRPVVETPSPTPPPSRPAPSPATVERATEPESFEDEAPLEEPPAVAYGGYDEMGAYRQAWSLLLRGLRGSTKAAMSESRPLRVEQGILVIGVPSEFRAEQATKGRAGLEESFTKALGRKMPLRFVVDAPANGGAPAPPRAESRAETRAETRRRSEPQASRPLEDLAAEVFQGDVLEEPNPFTE